MSSTFTFTAGYDADSLKRASKLGMWPIYFDARMDTATATSLEDLRVEARAWMDSHFKNPTGVLSDSLETIVDSPFQGQMGTDLPYGPRRNWGFTGMTDSLGRYYSYDPGIAYMEKSIAGAAPTVILNYQIALNESFADVGV